MAFFVKDSYTDTAGTGLGSHVGELGAAWTKHTARTAGNESISTAGTSRNAAAQISLWYASGVPPTTDYYVAADFVFATIPASSALAINVRESTTAETFYSLRYSSSSNGWFLTKTVAGSQSNLVSALVPAVMGATNRAVLTVSGTTTTILTAYLDGKQVLTYTDTSSPITAVGMVGMQRSGTGTTGDTLGMQLDNLEAGTLDLVSGLFAQDSFTDVSGTVLLNHTPEIGGPWVRSTASQAGNGQITDAGRVRKATTNQELYYLTGTPPTPDYYVKSDLIVRSVPTTASAFGVQARMNAAGTNYYQFRLVWTTAAGFQWVLLKVTGGGSTTLVTVNATITIDQVYTMRLVVNGSTISALLNGVQVMSTSDSTITAAGFSGYQNNSGTNSSETSGFHFDNYEAGTLTAAAATPSPGSGTATVSATSTGLPRIAATGSATETVTATSTGSATARQAASGIASVSAQASGVPSFSGTASAVIPVSALSSGLAQATGAGSATVGVTVTGGPSLGTDPLGTGSLGGAGTATGVPSVASTATAVIGTAATSSATPTATGTGSATVAVTGNAQGTPTVATTASATLIVAADALARLAATGTASATIALAGVASGTALFASTADATIDLGAESEFSVSFAQMAEALLVLSATASGTESEVLPLLPVTLTATLGPDRWSSTLDADTLTADAGPTRWDIR